MRDATICVQLAATKELVEASKRKADILEDLNFSCSSLPLTMEI
jgi:hypothetical protein